MKGNATDAQRAAEIFHKLLSGRYPSDGQPLRVWDSAFEPEVVQALKTALYYLEDSIKQDLPNASKDGHAPRTPSDPWSDDEDFMLRRAVSRGYSLSEIASMLMRSLSGVLKRMHELELPQLEFYESQLPANHGKKWSNEEKEALKSQLKRGISIAEIAQALGRSERSIQMQAENLGYIPEGSNARREPKAFDKEELAYRFLHGESIPMLAKRYTLPEEAIRARLFYMGFGGSGPKLISRTETCLNDREEAPHEP